ncbi:MAG TPA: acyl-CoA synthetase, partial [Acidimicrobiia bacterium]|nr:acyl-CoA synthetase [Acidimicrobiia bacterium]
GAIVLAPTRGAQRGALGVAAPEHDIVVVDPDSGVECPRAEFDEHGRLINATAAIGEIVRRDPNVRFEGYYRNDAAAADRMRNGWYWSGDLAYRDADGVFYFAGRHTDWIRVDAENFAAAPVERILGRHPDVAAVAVYGVADPVTGDQVMAALELRPGATFDPTRFERFLAEQRDLGTKWAPTFVRIVERLPTTGPDKVDRKPLRAEAWATSDPVWWKPARDADYRLLTDADRAALRARFAEHGRADFAP